MSSLSAAVTGCMRSRLLTASCLVAASFVQASPALASDFGALFVTSSVYNGTAATVVVGRPLPNSSGVAAIADGT